MIAQEETKFYPVEMVRDLGKKVHDKFLTSSITDQASLIASLGVGIAIGLAGYYNPNVFVDSIKNLFGIFGRSRLEN